MKFLFLIFIRLISFIFSIEEFEKISKRLTYKEISDPDNTFYVLNSEEEYKTIKNLNKNETIKNTSSFTYEWSNHITNQYVSLKDSLPKGDPEGYRDMTKYDYIYLNIYSKNNVGSKIIMVIECQKREPDAKSAMKVAYKSHIFPINFVGWKEIKIPFNILDDGYGGDLSKVSNLILNSNG